MVEIPTDWTAYPPDSDSGNWEIEDEYGHTATVYGEGEMAKAIALLVAAAPELLAALKLLRDPDGDGRWRCDCDDPHFKGGMCENCVATAAIAKAEGRP